jgi:hypothetical protein
MWRFFLALSSVVGFALPLAAQAPAKSPSVDSGVLHDGLYRNRAFGFSYQLPFGWVDRTKEPSDQQADPAKAQVLLAVFEQPPEAARDTVNSAVTISAESVSSYPGLKTAADYFGPVTELSKRMGLGVVTDPYEVRINARQLVRGDFKKETGKSTMYWTSLAMLARKQVVLFTFVASSEDEIEDLVGRLSFATSSSGAKQ